MTSVSETLKYITFAKKVTIVKENIFDVLMYLFENYMDDENQLNPDPERLQFELTEAGFHSTQVDKAFDWLEGLTEQQESKQLQQNTAAIRVYQPQEAEKLNTQCQGFLLSLEQMGILDPVNREVIIDRAIALEVDELDLDRLKWVILMVLLNSPGQEKNFAWLEDLVYGSTERSYH